MLPLNAIEKEMRRICTDYMKGGKMEKIGYGRHTVTGEPIVLLRDLPEILLKVNELVEECNELKKRVLIIDDDVTGRLDDYIHRLNNHINNHKEYVGGGRPVPK